jgi:hypothetical protein
MVASTAEHLPGPPKLALITAGLMPFVDTHSIAWRNLLKLPLPVSLNTFTAWSVASFATP